MTIDTYSGPERRADSNGAPPPDSNGRWEWLHMQLESIGAKVDAQHISIIDTRNEIQHTKQALIDHVDEEMHAYKTALSGFPGDDPVAHRLYHEQLIIESERRAKFWQEMRTELGKHTLRGLILVIGALIIYYWNGHVPGVQFK